VRAKILTAVLFAVSAHVALAQAAGQARADSAAASRAQLEQQVRERIAQVTRERLGATDEQMTKLQATNQKFDEQRRLLVDQERTARVALRKQMLRPDPAQQEQVSVLLDRVNTLQRQRLDINEAEQKELSGYLSPVQRAKYFALEQQVRQRVNQMRQAQAQAEGRGAARVGRAGRGRAALPPRKPR
jgi:hypothetical protein